MMHKNKMALAEQYYTFIGEKNLEGFKKFLHPDVELCSPLGDSRGKEAVTEATSNFMKTIDSLTIRTKFGTEEQAMIVYDVDIPGIKIDFPGASLLSFHDGLIVRIDLFFDASSFLKMKK